MFDPARLNGLPDGVRSILQSGAGDYLGSIAASAAGGWSALSSRAQALRHNPELTPLNRTMAGSLAVTISGLTKDAELQQHYLALQRMAAARRRLRSYPRSLIKARCIARCGIAARWIYRRWTRPDLLGDG
jgi:hypothetical protein